MKRNAIAAWNVLLLALVQVIRLRKGLKALSTWPQPLLAGK